MSIYILESVLLDLSLIRTIFQLSASLDSVAGPEIHNGVIWMYIGLSLVCNISMGKATDSQALSGERDSGLADDLRCNPVSSNNRPFLNTR